MTKPWESLLKPSKITILPQPGRDMTASISIEYEYNDSCSLQHKSLQLNNDRMVAEYEYPDMFKKLVAACDDVYEAWELYQRLQEPVPVNWKDHM